MKKKLLAYKISGRTYTSEDEYFDWENILGVDIEQWHEKDLNGNKSFDIIFDHEDVLSGYSDISSIENWHKFGVMVANDYLVIKDQIKYLMMDIGWVNLTNIEKDLCIRYYALPDFQQPVMFLMMDMGMSQEDSTAYIIKYWHRHHGKLLEVCRERWFHVKLVVASYLNFADAEELMDLANNLIFNFIECGRFGKEYGDQRDGLLDFITSKHSFIGQGLEEQGYILNFGNWNQFIGEMVNVLLHGIYNKNGTY